MKHEILVGDVLAGLRAMPDASVQCVVTSPPYWGLRDYGVEGQIGLEPAPDGYVERMVGVFREVRRVLRDDGVLWLNLGDSYNGSGGAGGDYAPGGLKAGQPKYPGRRISALKPKDLVGIPWRVAFALQEDGWYLRSDIIWCLSGGTWLYVKSQKGVMPMTVKDLARLTPSTVQLWNGIKWTTVKGTYPSPKPERAIEIVLRSGERIGCTEGHVWPTTTGDKKARDLKPGDVLKSCQLPNSEEYLPHLPADSVGWFVGTFLADGSWGKGGDVIQIASNTNETARFEWLCEIASMYGGTCRMHTGKGQTATINLYGEILVGILNTYIEGRSAKTKHLKNAVWKRGNPFLKALLTGYLEGDGHYEPENRRWRVGCARNYLLERDLRIICARLRYSLTLNLSVATMDGREFKAFRGEIRSETSGHHNEKSRNEIVEICQSKGRKFWDIEVEDEPNLFALASGVLTHNSKPNPMPESVTDRPTKSHEYVFLLTKSSRYFYDADAVREAHISVDQSPRKSGVGNGLNRTDRGVGREFFGNPAGRNRRSVWEIATQPTPEAHFATFPEALVEPCIKAGTSERGCCPECGAPWRRVTEREEDAGLARSAGGKADEQPETDRAKRLGQRRNAARAAGGNHTNPFGGRVTARWEPTCTCSAGDPIPCVVLDPFGGSGTVAKVARDLGRSSVMIELNPAYVGIMKKRLRVGEQLDTGVCEYAVREVGA